MVTCRVTRVSSFILLLGTHLSAQELAKHRPDFGTVPLYFEENKGQTDAQARYIARSANLVGFVLQDGWTLSLSGQPVSMHIQGRRPKCGSCSPASNRTHPQPPPSLQTNHTTSQL